MNSERSRWRICAVLLLIGLTATVYWPVQEYGFINYDDPIYVSNNRHVRAGITGDGLLWAFTTMETGHWHPLTWISHMADYQLFLNNPAGHHWTNVLIHLVNTLLLLGVLMRMTGRFWRSFLVASLFALHPLNVESVAWISERKNVLSTFFWLLTVCSYLYYAAAPGIRRYVLLFVAFLLGLLTKPMLVPLPFALLLLDFWPLGRLRLDQCSLTGEGGTDAERLCPEAPVSRLVAEKVPLFILAGLSAFMTIHAAGFVHTIAGVDAVSLMARLQNATVSYGRYLVKMVCPYDLAVFYPHPVSWSPREVWLSIILLLLITGLVFIRARLQPYLMVGWLWYLGTLVPVIGLVQVGEQAMADRYAYLPLIGIFMMVVWGGADFLWNVPQKRKIFVIAALLLLLPSVIISSHQVQKWRSDEVLFADALRKTDRNHLAHYWLGLAAALRGDIGTGIDQYREALRIKPLFVEAHNGLGHLLMVQGRDQEAVAHYHEAIRIRPDFVPALKNLGDVRIRQGKADEAISVYRRALIHSRKDPELLNNYGVALFLNGDTQGAVWNFRQAVSLDPCYKEAQDNLRKVSHEQNNR